MPSTDVQLINNGLSKISTSRIGQIAPPRTPLEVYMAGNYPIWKREELTKHRWLFATIENYELTLEDTLVNVRQPFKYRLPNNCLRPLRDKRTEWKQRGRYLLSAHSSLRINFIGDVAESDNDPLFDTVIGCKVAFESCEYVTQSATKKQAAMVDYAAAIETAYQCNAFVRGPEDIEADDTEFAWLDVRHSGS